MIRVLSCSPNFSRLAQSWKNQAGWNYRFYLDNDIEIFLSTHFPPEVKEAYDALSPGAFKADLFRYCVLFVYGGVYADVDVLLESKLDVVIENDVGFMVPLDRVSQINVKVYFFLLISCVFFVAWNRSQQTYVSLEWLYSSSTWPSAFG